MEEKKNSDSAFQRLFSNKIIMALFFFGAGAASVWSYNRFIDFKNSGSQFSFSFGDKEKESSISDLFGSKEDPFSDEAFGKESDPFAQIQRLQKQMEKMMEDSNSISQSFGTLQGEEVKIGAAKLEQREDDDFVYYDILFQEKQPQGINVEVRGGQISISGQMQSKDEGFGGTRVFSSSFHRSFPVPPNVDSENYKMEEQEDRIILKFPKLKDV